MWTFRYFRIYFTCGDTPAHYWSQRCDGSLDDVSHTFQLYKGVFTTLELGKVKVTWSRSYKKCSTSLLLAWIKPYHRMYVDEIGLMTSDFAEVHLNHCVTVNVFKHTYYRRKEWKWIFLRPICISSSHSIYSLLFILKLQFKSLNYELK